MIDRVFPVARVYSVQPRCPFPDRVDLIVVIIRQLVLRTVRGTHEFAIDGALDTVLWDTLERVIWNFR